MLKYMPLVGSALLTIIIVGFIVYWVIQSRRKIGLALKGPVRSLCCNADISDIVWTADGWVATCHSCGGWQYFGDHEYEIATRPLAADPPFDMRPPSQVIPLDSRRQAPRPAATEPAGEGQLAGRLEDNSMAQSIGRAIDPRMPEVTSDERRTGKSPALGAPYGRDCTCNPADRPPVCQHLYAAGDCMKSYALSRDEYTAKRARAAAHVARAYGDEGEPLAVPPQPNLGGEGSPDYQGPHYRVQHDRFVPYDVLRDPVPGAAVHIVGPVACMGPLEEERGDATLDISREDKDGQ
jgi:hypothetical protein